MSRLDSKVCAKCKLELPYAAFNKHGKRKDGLQTTCKNCMRVYRANGRYKATLDAYRKTERGHEIVRGCRKAYRSSEKGRAAEARYRKSDKGLAYDRWQKTASS